MVDTGRGRIVGRVDVGGPARHVTLVGSQVWTALGTKAERVAVVDVSRPERARACGGRSGRRGSRTTWARPLGGRRVWITSGDRRELAIYAARSGHGPLRRLRADAPPQHVTFGGGRAYVTSGDDGLLRVHALDGTICGRRACRPARTTFRKARAALTPSLSRGTLCVMSPTAHWCAGCRLPARRTRLPRAEP